ncbi:tubulin polyglutamylase [Chloropicon primus]|uniref:Tubulin polyglutamylase n=2 Tax=Chloropicon primus TaxID=1764295 RepID=A0A5B8ME89_9CHLO|nr:tubulin polyglutamylase [Chloropicon primus]|eukprot:QDZ18743.1 tubulin polyglutamylase [Chloropicon primus]
MCERGHRGGGDEGSGEENRRCSGVLEGREASTTTTTTSSSGKKRLYYKFGDIKDGQVCAPVIVRRVLEEEGWREAGEDVAWNLFWKSGRFTVGEYDRARSFDQRLNHFAKSGQICTKDSLVRIMRRNKATHGRVYDFVPETYLLPNEYNKFIKSYGEQRDQDTLWICKPTDLSRGQKIFVMKDIRELVYDCSSVIQRYIHNPLLVGGYKFDLRIYVLVSSMHPLKIHLFQDGLCRFGTVPYSKGNYSDIWAHLTNFSINKNSPTYDWDKDTIGVANKWTLRRLTEYLRSRGVPMEAVMLKIKALVILSLVSLPGIVPKTSSGTCFELFGFDVILSSDFKPWLLEVNTSPALGIDCFEDEDVKEPLIRDLLSAVQFGKLSDRKRERKRPWSRRSGTRVLTGKTSDQNENGEGTFQMNHAGQYEQIFPFNQKTFLLSNQLDCAKDPVPIVKQVIAEIKTWKRETMKEIRNQKV